MSADAGDRAWNAALLRIDRAVRGLPPLPEALEADVVEILNGVAATAGELLTGRADTEPAPGFRPFDGEEDVP